MSNEKIVLNIANFQASERLKNFMSSYDTDNNGLSEAEAMNLAAGLNGEESLKKEFVANASDELKSIMGLTASAGTTNTGLATNPAKAADKTGAKATKTPLEEVREAYVRARGYDPVKGGKLKDAQGNEVNGLRVKAAYEAVEAQFENKGKEYKAALKEVRMFAKHVDAHFVAEEAVKASKSTTSRQVEKDAEQMLKDANGGKMDDWEKRALHDTDGTWLRRGTRWFSGKNSNIKELRKAVAAGNKANEVKQNKYTQKDFEDAIGKRSPFIKQNITITDKDGKQKQVNALEAAGLITDDGKGNYDIKNLSAVVKRALGSDNTANREKHEGEREVERVKDELRNAGVNVGKITDRDIRQLIEFCGYRVQHKNWANTIYAALLGGAFGAASGAAAAATNPKNIVKAPIDIHEHVEVPINLGSEDLAQQLLDAMKNNPKLQGLEIVQEGANGAITTEIGNITKVGAEVTIIVDQLVKQNRQIDLSKYVLNTAVKTGFLGAAAGLAAGLLDYGPSEKGVFPTTLDCTSYEGLMRIIEGRKADGIISEEIATILKLVAMEFVETTKGEDGIEKAKTVKNPDTGECELVFNCEGFSDKLRKAAGNDNLSVNEIIAMARKYANPAEQPKGKEDCNQQPPVQQAPQPECKVVTRGDIRFKEANDCDGHQDANNYGWHEIIQMFYSDCLPNHSEKEIRFALRKANGIPNNLPYVPAGLILPYQLFEGENECTRTECRPVKKGNYQHNGVIKNSIKVKDAEFEAGIECKQNGQTTTTWLGGKYKTKEEAEAAGQKELELLK